MQIVDVIQRRTGVDQRLHHAAMAQMRRLFVRRIWATCSCVRPAEKQTILVTTQIFCRSQLSLMFSVNFLKDKGCALITAKNHLVGLVEIIIATDGYSLDEIK